MLNREQNDLVTRTNKGTPGGEMLRRYWQPVALSRELTDDKPLPVDVMGEELVLFRNEKGQPQLIGRACPHRAVDLSYGRVENGGLRCPYHGWLLSGTGRCLEQPGEPDGSAFKSKIRHAAYPCHDLGGLIFAYLGPLDAKGEAPRLPNFPFMSKPTEHTFVIKVLQECNYLQANEGNIDPQHLSYLHRFISNAGVDNAELNTLLINDPAPQIEVEETAYGLRLFAARVNRPGKRFVRITNFIMPNASSFHGSPLVDPRKGAVNDNIGYQLHWHVPVDDYSHWKYTLAYRSDGPVDKEFQRNSQFAEISENFLSPRTRQNRYMQDRDEMKHTSFVGLGRSFQSHDKLATEAQGAILDRSNEHLGTTDRAVIMMRRQLLKAIEDIGAGRDPMFVERDGQPDALNEMVVLSQEVPADADLLGGWWRDFDAASRGRLSVAEQRCLAMQRSTKKILTTHVGSLPEPEGLDSEAKIAAAVSDVVKRQRAIGLDIVNEGEYTKGGDWLSYVDYRFGGFSERPRKDGKPLIMQGKDREDFAEFYDYAGKAGILFYAPGNQIRHSRPNWVCTGPVTYQAQAEVRKEIETLKANANGNEVFLTSTAPASLEVYRKNEFYKSEEEYLFAFAEALRVEYEMIAKAGLILQVDDAWLPALWDRIGIGMGLEAFRKRCAVRIEALNHALRNIPQEQIRYHLCWGSWHGPHAFDLEMIHIVDIMLNVKAEAYLIEAANARHEHEYAVWESVKLPTGKILIPGVISHATDGIEHPELVSQRIQRFAKLVGRENVIAGADCGFGGRSHPQIAWAKLRALTEGAALASKALGF